MSIHVTILNTLVSVGDLVNIQHRIKEGAKERVQIFSGIVIAIRGGGVNASFTVRRIATGGVGVEKIWPVNSPSLAKIEVKKRGSVRRAKLYYLRKRVGKEAIRVKSGAFVNEKEKPGKPGRESGPEIPSK